MEQFTAHIALGANLGNREQTLQNAIEILDNTPGISVCKVSEFIETAPVGGPENQPAYLNAAAELTTNLTPNQLLCELNKIEAKLGRDRQSEERFGPRTCDLDILLIEDKIVNTPELTIPHPRMHQREFVLVPLVEIAPEAYHPKLALTAGELLQILRQAK